ncbi:hypothetical protein BGZ57DRAFT_19260 [Hyaloscypha finlandica]|nr:hypothetical protein BGZ57DRAFT_19260 [Hyaloscypha finlandica]
MVGGLKYRSDNSVFIGSASPPLGDGSPTPKSLTSKKVSPGFVGNSLGHNQKGDKNRGQKAGPSGLQPRNSRFDRDPRTRSWSLLIQEDPLSAQQMIRNHLTLSSRTPIASVYDLATLITDCCANVLD